MPLMMEILDVWGQAAEDICRQFGRYLLHVGSHGNLAAMMPSSMKRKSIAGQRGYSSIQMSKATSFFLNNILMIRA